METADVMPTQRTMMRPGRARFIRLVAGPDRWIFLIAALAIVVRLAYLAAFGGLDDHLHDSSFDQTIYLDVARNLAAGHGFSVSSDTWVAVGGKPTSIVNPVYPMLIAASFRLFGESLIPIRLLQSLLVVVMILSVYYIGCRLFSRRAAIVAGVLIAFYPPLVMYVRPMLSESLFFGLLAILLAVTCTLEDSHPTWRFVLWGVLAGLATLTRTETAFLVLALLVFFAYRLWRRSGFAALAPCAAALIVFALLLVPYAAYNYAAHGIFSPTPNKKWAFWERTWWAEMREHPEWQGVALPERKLVPDWATKTEVERDAYLGQLGLQFVLDHPRIFLVQRVKQLHMAYPILPLEELRPRLEGQNYSAVPDGHEYGPTSLDDAVRYVTPIEKVRVWSFRVILLLAACGIVLTSHRRRWRASWLLIILVWNIVCVTMFYGNERYRLQIDPYLILIGAVFLDFMWARAVSAKSRQEQDAVGHALKTRALPANK